MFTLRQTTVAPLAIAALILAACGAEEEASSLTVSSVNETISAVPSQSPTHEHGWKVEKASSHLTFTGTAYGKEAKGTFNDFTADIILDVENPAENGIINATISMASFTTGDSDQEGTLPSKNWFWVKEYPTAQFSSSNITKESDGTYHAGGTLTIRGVSQPVTLPFTLSIDGDRAIANGELTLNRQDFGVGQGAYAKPEDILPGVTVDVHIEAIKNP
ncbi:MAG: YceI family protein [Pseudomonadota bacterium]